MKLGLKKLKKICIATSIGAMLTLTAPISSVAEVPPIIGVLRSDTTHSLFGYQVLSLGDQNNDGYSDFLIWDLRVSAYFYHGASTIDSVPFLRIDSINAKMSNVGDVNGDGYEDIAALGRSPFGFKLGLYLGGPAMDSIRDWWFGWDTLQGAIPCLFIRDPDCTGHERLFAASFNFRSVFVADPFSQDTLPTFQLRPFWMSQPGAVFGDALVKGDFNGDGFVDIAINARPSGPFEPRGEVCIYSGGCAFDTVPMMTFAQSGAWTPGKQQFGSILVNLGDINGDGFQDLYVGHGNSTDTTNFVFFGGPTFDSIPDLSIPDHTERTRAVGDLNGDGYDDFMSSLSIESSSFSYIKVYYGGPNVNSIPDMRINVWEMPEYLILFGMDIAGLGDVNGDGINDFAASGEDVNGHGVVYIFSGSGKYSDVREQGDDLPTQFNLHQNYPNPFNPSTTIEFELVSPARAVVRVYNSLGEIVRTLVDRQLAVGLHRVVWDGRDDQGREVASGVYLYRLTAGDVTQEKKMVLVR